MSSKYKKQIIIIIILAIFFVFNIIGGIIQTIIQAQQMEGWVYITPLLPIKNVNLLIPVVLFITIFANIIGGVIMGYILGPLSLYVHKKIIGKKLIYGVQERPKINVFKGTLKGFFPTLMAFGLALWLIEHKDIAKLFVDESILQSEGGYFYGIFVIIMITSGIAMGLFSSVWFLFDSGIVYSNIEKVKLSTKPIEVRSVGGLFQNFLKGYTGISVILTFYTFMIWEVFSVEMESFQKILTPILILFIPIIFSILALPAIVILDKTLDKRKNYMLKFAKKLGIVETMDLTITLSDPNKLSPRDD